MSVGWVAILCAAAAGFLWPRGRPLALRRLEGLLGVEEGVGGGGPGWVRGRWVAAALGGVAVAVLVGGSVGLVAGGMAAGGVGVVLGRLEPRERRERRALLVADLPVAVDLLAACLSGGASWGEAVEAVANAVRGPLGEELQGVAAQVRLGADPASAWLALAGEPELAPLARTAARAVDSGAALAPALARLGQDRRRAARSDAAARARAAGIRAVAPLGLCFLPAFVLLGVVPAIAGIASTLLLPV